MLATLPPCAEATEDRNGIIPASRQGSTRMAFGLEGLRSRAGSRTEVRIGFAIAKATLPPTLGYGGQGRDYPCRRAGVHESGLRLEGCADAQVELNPCGIVFTIAWKPD
jgi:hypothetical protein